MRPSCLSSLSSPSRPSCPSCPSSIYRYAGKVSAEYKNGVLTVRLPLREEAKPRQIKVDVAA